MATHINLDKTIVQAALSAKVASLRRSLMKEFNPAMRELIEKDMALISNAMNTIKETK